MSTIKAKHNTAQIAALVNIAIIACLLAYLPRNTTGHTGFSPYWALLIFAPSVLLGAANMMATMTLWKDPWHGIIPTLTGALGTALLVCLDKANVLLQYDVWIKRGMP